MQNYKVLHRIFAGIAFLFSLIVYLKTIAPTVSFWDCGEFITCSYILGVPHPPGAPFYLLLGRLFTMLPLAADIGLRVNIISALSTALTVMFTYLIIVKFIKQWRGEAKNWEDVLIFGASGLIGAFAFAFTDTLWFNAVEAEVYAISMFITASIVWLMLEWHEKADEPGSERYLLFLAYMVGLAIGIHLLMILALPAIFLIVYFHYLDRHNEKISIKNVSIFALITAGIFIFIYPGVVQWMPRMAGNLGGWSLLFLVLAIFLGIYFAVTAKKKITSLALVAALLVITGYSTYTMIYIRSNLDPAVDENDPETLEQMVKYLNREQYGTWSTFPRRYPGLPQPWEFERKYPGQNYATFNLGKQLDFMWNYQIKKMYLRYFGWQFIGKGTTLGADNYIKENFSLNGLLGLPFLIGLIGMVHHYYRNWRHAFSITALFIMTGIAIVIYLNQEDPQPRERDYVYVGSFFAFALWIGMGVTAMLEWIQEAFHDKAGMRKILYAVIIVAFTLMAPVNLIAHNYDQHDRTGNYVAYDYSYNILQSCEPNAILFTNGDNDTFPLWFLQYVYNIRTDVRVVNLSLLNTSWYIKQLKNEEPRVPISMTDEQIDALEIQPWRTQKIAIPVPPKAFDEALSDLGERKALLENKIERIKEITVTVRPTIAGQGLRVQDLMILNIIYANRWRKPINFAVTVSDNNKVDLQRYLRMDGLAFKLVPYEGKYLALERLEKNLMEVFQYRGLNDPDVYFNNNIIGLLQNYRAAFLRLAREYMMAKKYDKMLRVLDRMEEVLPEEVIPVPDVRLSLQIGQMYDIAGRKDEFLRRAERAVEQFPDNAIAMGTLISLLSREGYHDRAISLLEDWLKKYPDDREARRKLEMEKKLLAPAGSDTAGVDTPKTVRVNERPSRLND